MPTPLHELSAAEAARHIEARELTAEALAALQGSDAVTQAKLEQAAR